jgi:hypothetical protein
VAGKVLNAPERAHVPYLHARVTCVSASLVRRAGEKVRVRALMRL